MIGGWWYANGGLKRGRRLMVSECKVVCGTWNVVGGGMWYRVWVVVPIKGTLV